MNRERVIKSIVKLLDQRIATITSKSPTEATGGIALLAQEDYKDKLEYWLEQAIATIGNRLGRSKDAMGIKLTSTSMSIGRKVLQQEVPEGVLIQVGNLFVEALFLKNYIKVHRQPAGENSSYEPPIMIIDKDTFKILLPDMEVANMNLLSCTTETKPEPTTRMWREIGNYKGPLLKRCSKKNSVELDAIWVQAADKQQQTGWKLNVPVYEAVFENQHLFISSTQSTESDKSKAIAYNSAISKATAVKDMETFYQGVDVDYRGRFYTIESGLEYQGADAARGIFLFSDGVELTESGLWWIKIHTACSFNESFKLDELPEWLGRDTPDGPVVRDYYNHLINEGLDSISVDKMALVDQVSWTDSNLDRVIELGREQKFWTSINQHGVEKALAEKPVSFLACCYELYMESITPAGEAFITHLPVPIDAHSSGWQHLGAMTHDEQTGALVGLIASDIPIDFYLSVAKGVIRQSKVEDPEVYDFVSSLPMKMVRKCITKRSSMILAYSAGAKTLASTIVEDSKAEDLIVDPDLAKRIAKLVISTIKEICPGPLGTMNYFQNLAKHELGEFGKFRKEEDWEREYESVMAKVAQEEEDGIPLDLTLLELEFIEQCTKSHKSMKNRRKLLLKKKKNATEDELLEISHLTVELKTYESILTTGSGSKFIKWKTQSGFNVQYENYFTYAHSVPGFIYGYGNKGGYINHVLTIESETPDLRSFISGISPNIVHSFDAAQLALTCVRHNGVFAGIHDSYSTHASDVDSLLSTAKQVFIDMYKSNDFLEELTECMLTHPETFDRDERPDQGCLDLEKLHDSATFFS